MDSISDEQRAKAYQLLREAMDLYDELNSKVGEVEELLGVNFGSDCIEDVVRHGVEGSGAEESMSRLLGELLSKAQIDEE